MTLTEEQQYFIDLAKSGKNVLVDACIGSGKTTTIQYACHELSDKSILYLTYNRRLLLEARDRIHEPNVDVHTFHSFAGTCFAMLGIACSSEREAPAIFNERVDHIKHYDVIIVDEYQDLGSDLAGMLRRICYVLWEQRPGFMPQFLVVGDMDQKIYDYTAFDAHKFITEFLSILNGGYEHAYFSRCFRLSADFAADIGQAWGKSIVGVNDACHVSEERDLDFLVLFLAKFEPKDILVLGSNNGVRTQIQNRLEEVCPKKFNKDTVYSSLSDRDADMSNMDTSHAAIFTTYDSAKGLERRVCVVCNFTEPYLQARMKHSISRSVLKNLFLVAASRGREHVIFYVPGRGKRLQMERFSTLSGPVPVDMRPESMSSAFDFKNCEDVDQCFGFLTVEKVYDSGEKINAMRKNGMIDLSACVGIYAQAVFFKGYDIDDIVYQEMSEKDDTLKLPEYRDSWKLPKKVLYLMSLDTGQTRYVKQVSGNYVDAECCDRIKERLSGVFDGNEPVERSCSIIYKDTAHGSSRMGDKLLRGRCDVLMKDCIYELKFVSALKTEHMLQTALYITAFEKPCGYLWNLYDGEMYKILVSDRSGFLGAVCRCVSKGLLTAGMAYIPKSHNSYSL